MCNVGLILEWYEIKGDDLVGLSSHIQVQESEFEAAFGLEPGLAYAGGYLITPSTAAWIHAQFGVQCNLDRYTYFASYVSLDDDEHSVRAGESGASE